MLEIPWEILNECREKIEALKGKFHLPIVDMPILEVTILDVTVGTRCSLSCSAELSTARHAN